ncbi:hypothetical protein T06_13307 [Trichinella sp. T6]|nr:hypothetical protein T06_13307 [Trichinella sp. T6]
MQSNKPIALLKPVQCVRIFCVRERRLENASGCHEFFTGCWKTVPIVRSDASTMRAYSAVGWVEVVHHRELKSSEGR